MPYVYFTEEQKERANSTDLVDFLHRQGEKLLPSGRDKRLSSDHSITVRGNSWYDHEIEKGGLAIDFIKYFYGKSFPDAVSTLLNGEQGIPYEQSEKRKEEPQRPFELPPASPNMRRTFAYLLKVRYLDNSVITAFVKAGLLFESLENSKDGAKQYHNAIFVGRNKEGTAKHAHKKGIYTYGQGFRGNLPSSDPKFSFHWTGTSDMLYVFEAPIDLLSYISLYKKKWEQHSYVALCGVSSQPVFQLLQDFPNIKKVRLCLDHDTPGLKSAVRITKQLLEKKYTDVKLKLSEYKDWNDDVKALHGQLSMPPEEPTGALQEDIKELLNMA
ncbi:DUF3991 and toprim domain-containing protein [Hungatella effluvii]|uniref:DUF3991 and toprim domain-containing protein n=1 Tax=Hungatella effluvii TaxID=1096246 RepID=UPI0022E91B9D|nr:DUF3991 and toprim domain-containing protein [Hungatella effluvii]